jgi:hypothetical protein
MESFDMLHINQSNIFPFSASILTFSKIETLKGKIFNSNENNENHKVYPSACGKKYSL